MFRNFTVSTEITVEFTQSGPKSLDLPPPHTRSSVLHTQTKLKKTSRVQCAPDIIFQSKLLHLKVSVMEWQRKNKASVHRTPKEFAVNCKSVRGWCQCYHK